MTVRGDNQANQIAITDDGHGNISATIDGHTASGTGIKHVVVEGRKGDDTISYTLTGVLVRKEKLEFRLGQGTDQLTLDFTQGATAAHLNIDVDGSGADTISSTFGDLNNTDLDYNASLGRGAGTMTTALDGNILGTSHVHFNVHSGPGNDSVQFKAVGAPDPNNPTGPPLGVQVDARSTLAFNVDGGPGQDGIVLDYAGDLGGKLRIGLNGGRGADTITTNVTADTTSSGSVFARVHGGAGNDNLTLNVNDNSGGTLGSVNALLDGGAGTDTATDTSNVHVIHCEG
jgi:hypothetical protein